MTVAIPRDSDALLDRRAPGLASAILDLAAAIHAGRGHDEEEAALAERLTHTMALADLLARARIFRRARGLGAFASMSAPVAPDQDLIPRIAYSEAVAQIALREPRLLLGVPSGVALDEAMGALYASRGFALAKATTLNVTEKVHRILDAALRSGESRLTTEALIAEAGDWSRAYANVVYRNNVNTAYTGGTFAGMRDPDVAAVLPALRFDAVRDSDTTAICVALHGTLAPPGHPIWEQRSTPAHHGCRSSLTEVDILTLKRSGAYRDGAVVVRIPNPSARAAPGFGGRRDLPIYGPPA